MAKSSFYSSTGVTADNPDVDPVAPENSPLLDPVAPSNITAIEDSKNAAALSEAAAAASAAASATSASSGAASASTATTKASESAASATASSNSAAASQASRVASEAAKVAAETAETNASTSAATATTQAGIATTKAGEAATSATSAASSASSAQASKDAALAALDSFDDRYLGQKTADPTLDNDGDALVSGALYFNTTDDIMKVYEGSLWVAAYASLSGALLATNNLSDLTNAATARTNLGLGTAATTAATDYATAAQGALAASATQPGDLATVATSGAYGDLSGTPTLGTASTSAATDFVAVSGDSMTGNLSFGDNDKATFGSSADLQVYHDGFTAWIDNIETGTKDTAIRVADGGYITLKAGSDNLIQAVGNGSTSIYHNGSTKLATTTTGIDVTGTVTMDGATTSANINFGDNDKAIFGAGSDLQIFHTGSYSAIRDVGTGGLFIGGENYVDIGNAGASATYARFHKDAQVDLYHNNSVKLSTTTTGIDVTGTVTATSYAGDGSNLAGVLRKGADIGASVDLNTYITDGYYHQNSNANATSGTNYPAALAGMLTVTSDGNMVYQKYQTYDGNGTYQRTKYNVAGWYDWDKILDSGNLTTTGTLTATAFAGDGSALTGIAAGATGGGNDDIFYENGQNVTTNYTITNGKNAMSAGPITINSGVTVTVGAGETWTVI